MSWIDGARARLGQWLWRSGSEDRMSEEIRFHLEQEMEKNVRAGMSPAEARRRALVQFGGVEKYREELRDGWRMPLVGGWGRELRWAARGLARSPRFSAVVVATLALGIGATAAVFSLVDGVLLRPAPFPLADELVVVWETDRATGTVREPAALPDFLDFQAQSRTLEQIAAVLPAPGLVAMDAGDVRRMPVVRTTHEYLGVVGIEPVHGRGLLPGEDAPGADPVALISEAMWASEYQRDPDVLGRQVTIDGFPYSIVGVVPEDAGFGLLQVLSAADYAPLPPPQGEETRFDLWAPLPRDVRGLPRSTHPLFMVGRLAPGATVDAADAEMTDIAAELEAVYPENENRGANVQRLTEIVFAPIRPALLLLLSAVAIVLVLACVNVANLLLARGRARSREIALRRSLGAGAIDLVRQFVAESAILTAAATLVGGAVAWFLLRVALALAPATLVRIAEVSLDGRALLVILGTSLAVTFLVGAIPALQALRLDVRTPIAEGSPTVTTDRGSRRLGAALIAAEVGLAVVLFAGAALLIRSFWEVRQVDTGFRTDVVKAEVTLPLDRYPISFETYPDIPETVRFYGLGHERLSRLPGVAGVALAGTHPLDRGFANSFVIVGREDESADLPEIATRQVSPGYFDLLGTPLADGRFLGPQDDAAAPRVAVINRAAAELLFPGGSPIGQQVRFWGEDRTIVGVIGNEKFRGITEDDPIAVYTPLAQTPSTTGQVTFLIAASAADPASLAASVQAAIREVDPGVAVDGIATLEETLAGSLAERTFTTGILGFFAAVSLLLAALGVFGVVSHEMARRTREVGIRLALGGHRQAVVRELVGRTLRPVVLGLAAGLAGAIAAGGMLRGLLFGVQPNDPATLLAVALTITAAAAAASLLPALRTTAIAPAAVLKGE